MENKKDFLTLFFMCAFLTSIVGVFLAFFLSKYNEAPLFSFSKENYIYEIIDKSVSLNWEEKLVSNISNEQNVYLKIKENDLREGKIYLTIINSEGISLTHLENFSYNKEFQGFDITNFKGLINLGKDSIDNKDKWVVKITYVNYHGHQYLNPQIIFNEP